MLFQTLAYCRFPYQFSSIGSLFRILCLGVRYNRLLCRTIICSPANRLTGDKNSVQLTLFVYSWQVRGSKLPCNCRLFQYQPSLCSYLASTKSTNQLVTKRTFFKAPHYHGRCFTLIGPTGGTGSTNV